MNRARSVGLDGVYCMAFMGFKITDCMCSTPCYALQYSIDRISVNVSSSVMITSALHLVGNDSKKKKIRSRSHSIL